MKRLALLALLLTGCVTVAPPSAVETAVAGTVQAYARGMATYSGIEAQAAPITCGCCVPTCPAPVVTAAPAPSATPTPTATPTPGTITPTRVAPVLTYPPPATLDYTQAEARYCGQWGVSMTAQNWLTAPAIVGGVNVRRGPGVEYEAVNRMQDEEVYAVLRQYTVNATTMWLCVYAIREGREIFGWSAQLYQGQKLLTVYP